MVDIKKILALWVLLCCLAFSQENALALKGLPSYESSPARMLQPAFGFRFESSGGGRQFIYGASGEFGKGTLRSGFVYDFSVMDSLYRKSYSELQLGYGIYGIWAGVGYGVSMEWIPGGDLWVRHRFKAGSLFEWRQMYLAGLLDGWFDDLKQTGFVVGGGAKVGENFDLFFQWNGGFLDLGAGVKMGCVYFSTVYQFPGFGTELSLGVFWKDWTMDLFSGFNNESFHRIGGRVSKRFGKKTIL